VVVAWRGAKREQPTDESRILRDGLIAMLELQASAARPAHAKEIRALVDRLGTGPAPTGLHRELGRLFGQADTSEDPAQHFGDTARALGDAMAGVALADPELERTITELRSSVPTRVQVDDARRLTSRARTLEDQAVPVKDRILKAQGEVALILEAVGTAISGTTTASGRLSKNAGKLARTFAETHDDVALRNMRGQITQALEALAKDAARLETRMTSTRQRTRDLERRVEKQAAILGVLDSCRRIKKDLERWGEGEDTPVSPVKAPEGLWDPLTGVYSAETHARLLGRASQAADDTGRPLSLVLVEVDGHEQIGRRYGKPALDTVLRTLGRQLVEVVDDSEVLSRVDPGRFALILPAVDQAEALDRARQARQVLAQVAFASRAGRFHVTLRSNAAARRPRESPQAYEKRVAEGLTVTGHRAGRK